MSERTEKVYIPVDPITDALRYTYAHKQAAEAWQRLILGLHGSSYGSIDYRKKLERAKRNGWVVMRFEVFKA